MNDEVESSLVAEEQPVKAENGKHPNSVAHRFQKGNKSGGRRKGNRNRLTQEMLDRIANGVPPDLVLIDIYQDEKASPELRFKAAAKVSDLVYPKASSVEVTIDEKDKYTKEQVEERIQTLLKKGTLFEDGGE